MPTVEIEGKQRENETLTINERENMKTTIQNAVASLKGRVVCWFISNEFKTDAETLKRLGIEKTPTNAPKTALKKAMDIIKRTVERDIKLPKSERARKVQTTVEEGKHGFSLIIPFLDSFGVYRTKTALTVAVHKKHGVLEFQQIDATDFEFEQLKTQIKNHYSYERDSIDAEQFRNSVVKRFVDEFAFPMRTTGGVYFIDERDSEKFETLRALFENFDETTKLSSMLVYNDSETLDAIETATERKFHADFARFETKLQNAIDTGKLTTVSFREMKENFQNEILPKAVEYRENLRSKFAELEQKAENMVSIMTEKLNAAKSDVVACFDFKTEMQRLSEKLENEIETNEPLSVSPSMPYETETEPANDSETETVADAETEPANDSETDAETENENAETDAETDVELALRLSSQLES